MKILLIGKYPPMQGGISTKTFWLFQELEKYGFELKAVTVETCDYSIKGGSFNHTKSALVKMKESPWHIPESELLSDRIFQSAMEIIVKFNPDLIETNYLWPFSMPALLTAKIIEKPLIIRHAGSDIQKFYQDAEYKNNIRTYFEHASIVVTNHNTKSLIHEFCDNPEKVECLQRYVPNPDIFRPIPTEKQYDILFAGKINYYWNYKGLRLLIDLIKFRNLRSLFIIGGKYQEQVIELLEQKKISECIEVKSFIPPESMPAIYNSCKSVWCWDENESLEDFSNIIWEALYCSVPCIVNVEMADRITNEGIPDGFTPFIRKTNQKGLKDIDFSRNYPHEIDDRLASEKRKLYFDYINSNLELYKSCYKLNI